MAKNFSCFFEGRLCDVTELQEQAKFSYLPHCTFETEEERREIRERGLKQLERGEVGAEALELGKRFIGNIEASWIAPVSVRYLGKELGHGLFSEGDLDVGSYVGVYTGLIRKNDRRYFEPLNDYCYQYPVLDGLGRNYVIDATSGHLTRFLNHSDQPNVDPVYAFHEGFYYLIFLTMRCIEKGEQLTFNYGQNYWHLRGKPVAI
jgi:uncharacterized protein